MLFRLLLVQNNYLSLCCVILTRVRTPRYSSINSAEFIYCILYICPFRVCLLECSVREVRVVVASILEKTLESALHFGDPRLDGLTDALLSLLDKDVPENVKNCAQYFSLFSNFAQRVLTHRLICRIRPSCPFSEGSHDCSLFWFPLSGLCFLPVVVETLGLSQNAHLPVGTQQAKQPGRTAS